MSDSTLDVSKWALFKPFKRPLPLNLIVPVIGVAVWFVAFDQAVAVLGLGDRIAAESTAGRLARVQATAVANVAYGAFLSLATLAAYGWLVWNMFLSGFLTLHLPEFYFQLVGTPVPEPLFHLNTGLSRYGDDPERIMVVSFAWIVAMWLVFAGGVKLLGRYTRWKYWWIPKLPT